MTGTQIGEPPSSIDKMWQKAAQEELSPGKSLEAIESRAKFIFSNLALVATVLTGVGLFADIPAAARNQSPGVRRLFGLLFLAVLFALLANLPNLKSSVRIGNLAAVKRLLTWLILTRGWAARLAVITFSVVIVYGFWIVYQLSSYQPDPRMSLQLVRGETTDRSLSGSLTVERLPEGARAETTLFGVNGDSAVVLVRDSASPDAEGVIKATFKVAKVTEAFGKFRLSVEVRDGDDKIFDEPAVVEVEAF